MSEKIVLDPDLTLVTGISPEGVPYVGVTMQVNGKEHFVCDAIPEWFLRTWNDAAKRAKAKAA